MWAWVLRRYDRLEPEPIKVLLRVGLLGGLMSVIPAIIGNSLAGHFLGLGGFGTDLARRITLPLALGSAVFIGINEETWKFLATLRLVKKLPEFPPIIQKAGCASLSRATALKDDFVLRDLF